MPIATVRPNTAAADAVVRAHTPALRSQFKQAINTVWEAPFSDLLVNFERFDGGDHDPNAAAADVWVEDTPDAQHEKKADELRSELAAIWNTITNGEADAEVWIRFIPGSWCHICADGMVNNKADMHAHPTVKPLARIIPVVKGQEGRGYTYYAVRRVQDGLYFDFLKGDWVPGPYHSSITLLATRSDAEHLAEQLGMQVVR